MSRCLVLPSCPTTKHGSCQRARCRSAWGTTAGNPTCLQSNSARSRNRPIGRLSTRAWRPGGRRAGPAAALGAVAKIAGLPGFAGLAGFAGGALGTEVWERQSRPARRVMTNSTGNGPGVAGEAAWCRGGNLLPLRTQAPRSDLGGSTAAGASGVSRHESSSSEPRAREFRGVGPGVRLFGVCLSNGARPTRELGCARVSPRGLG